MYRLYYAYIHTVRSDYSVDVTMTSHNKYSIPCFLKQQNNPEIGTLPQTYVLKRTGFFCRIGRLLGTVSVLYCHDNHTGGVDFSKVAQ